MRHVLDLIEGARIEERELPEAAAHPLCSEPARAKHRPMTELMLCPAYRKLSSTPYNANSGSAQPVARHCQSSVPVTAMAPRCDRGFWICTSHGFEAAQQAAQLWRGRLHRDARILHSIAQAPLSQHPSDETILPHGIRQLAIARDRPRLSLPPAGARRHEFPACAASFGASGIQLGFLARVPCLFC